VPRAERRSLVLFDIDGTLVDTDGAGRRAIESAFEEIFGVAPVTARSARVRFAGMTDPAIFRALASAADIDPALYHDTEDALRRSYLRFLAADMKTLSPRQRVMPGIEPLLRALDRRERLWTGLLTGNIEAGARIKLEPFGLNGHFAGGGFGSDHEDRREVARLAWRRMCDLSGVEFPRSAVTVLGDTERDVDCARANGFRAVAVESGWVSREELEQAGPDALFADLTDLPAVLRALDLDPA
jgi:phosphoglycolate phosphatase-like HAD superfamily hydrolase